VGVWYNALLSRLDLRPDDLAAQSSRVTVTVHKSIRGVDAIGHRLHEAEGAVIGNPIDAVHEVDHAAHELRNVVVSALSTTVVVLASKLSDPEVLPEGGVPVLEVLDEGIGTDVVPVDSNSIDGASVAGSNEFLHPSDTIGVGRGGRRDEEVALVLHRLDVLHPQTSRCIRVHVGLTSFVGLVEAKKGPRVALNDGLLEFLDLVLTPEHRNTRKTELVGGGRVGRGPVVDDLGVGGDKGSELLVVSTPSEANLASTGWLVAAATVVGAAAAGAAGRTS